MNNQININVSACPIMLSGPDAQYHANHDAIKRKDKPFDAGIDLFPSRSPVMSKDSRSFTKLIVDTGIQMVFPPSFYGLITRRSSMEQKLPGASLGSGTIDSAYTGPIKIILFCLKQDADEVISDILTCSIERIAIAQIIPTPAFIPMWVQFPEQQVAQWGNRGNSGFGSTDLKIL